MRIILLSILALTLGADIFYPVPLTFQRFGAGILLFLLAVHTFIHTVRYWRNDLKYIFSRLSEIGFMVILMGVILGSVLGGRGLLALREGEQKDTFFDERQKSHKLSFLVKLNRFQIERYPNSGDEIKNFKSFLEIRESGEIKKDQVVEVNSPLRYKGYTFYQLDYDPQDEKWSGLGVVRDPGVSFVYTGFVLFFFGLVFLVTRDT